MLDAVIYNLTNQVKVITNTIDSKMDTLVGAWANQLTNIRSGLTDTRISFLDYLYTLETRLTNAWANQLTSLRTAYTDTRAGYLDLINAMNTRLSVTWAAKLDSLRTAYTDARAGYLDLVNTLNNRLTDVWSAQLTSLRSDVNATRLGYIDQIPSINSLALKSVKVRASGVALVNLATGMAITGQVSLVAGVFTTLLNITGSGKLKAVAAYVGGYSSMSCKIIIDGITVLELTATNNGSSVAKGAFFIGASAVDGAGAHSTVFDDVAFQVSAVVQLKPGATVSGNLFYAYELY